VQQKYAAAALTRDNVSEGAVLEFDQRRDQFLFVRGQDELIEGRVVKIDFGQKTHGNFTPLLRYK